MKYKLLVFCLVMASIGCSNFQEKKLIGRWQAFSLLEDGNPMPVPASVVGFEFFNNGCYHFTSTLKYREAGVFSVEGELLYTMDTLNEASTQKSVQILDLTTDSLILKMNAEGREQLVKLRRLR